MTESHFVSHDLGLLVKCSHTNNAPHLVFIASLFLNTYTKHPNIILLKNTAQSDSRASYPLARLSNAQWDLPTHAWGVRKVHLHLAPFPLCSLPFCTDQCYIDIFNRKAFCFPWHLTLGHIQWRRWTTSHSNTIGCMYTKLVIIVVTG